MGGLSGSGIQGPDGQVWMRSHEQVAQNIGELIKIYPTQFPADCPFSGLKFVISSMKKCAFNLRMMGSPESDGAGTLL
jgi:hypothetical protein